MCSALLLRWCVVFIHIRRRPRQILGGRPSVTSFSTLLCFALFARRNPRRPLPCYAFSRSAYARSAKTETAVISNNVSILHHVTLGGTGKIGGNRYPKIGDGVLIGVRSVVLIDVPLRITAVTWQGWWVGRRSLLSMRMSPENQ
ncbi:putative serine acetyltransferase [Arachis hypogaea]|nr:putative serine acetyltransferase [Arachis hypogaea]